LILPLPYSIPGIGSGIMAMGLIGNAYGSYIDVYALGISGDAGGYMIGVEDIHLVSETLILDTFFQDLNKAKVQIFRFRGMNSGKDDFNFVEVNKVAGTETMLRLTLFERRLEFFGGMFKQAVAVTKISDYQDENTQVFNPINRPDIVINDIP